MKININIVVYLFLYVGFSTSFVGAKTDSPVVVVRNPVSNIDPLEYLHKISLPDGFKIELYTRDVPGARSMALGDDGTIFVGTRGRRKDPARKGAIYAVVDSDKNLTGDKVLQLANDLFMPNGVAFRDGSLYVAEPNRVLRYDDIEANLTDPGEPVVVNDSYPSDKHHGWKYIEFGPDGRLYVPVGAPCNICEPGEQHAVITSIKADGSEKRTEASGIRNTVGFDWHPLTGELWFTDNGRDLWGDDRPPEELNRMSKAGQHFGFPYEYGQGHRDGEFALPAIEFTPAALELPAHTAPLGMKFYTGDMFPQEYKNQLLIAHHGSWNRSVPAGFYISLVRFRGDMPQAPEIFAEGWLQGDEYWGRPADLLQLPDGSLLVSDDQAGCLYRISYQAGN